MPSARSPPATTRRWTGSWWRSASRLPTSDGRDEARGEAGAGCQGDARAVAWKNCRATVPLLKTRWLCKKDGKRVALTLTPKSDGTGVAFGIQAGVPVVGGNA